MLYHNVRINQLQSSGLSDSATPPLNTVCYAQQIHKEVFSLARPKRDIAKMNVGLQFCISNTTQNLHPLKFKRNLFSFSQSSSFLVK